MNKSASGQSIELDRYQIRDSSVAIFPQIELDPQKIEFGRVFCPNIFAVDYLDGEWSDPRLEPLRNLSLHPAAICLHYGQAIFEGLKAFRHPDNQLAIFRPTLHANRLNVSADILDMPELPQELFIEAITKLASIERPYVPNLPGSLYLRPTMIGTEPCLGVRSSSTYLFFVLALPTGSYFKETSSGAGSISVLISESHVRAAPGGTGAAKAAGNYAATLRITSVAKRMGCAQVLFLNAIRKRSIEEMGGMNIFFVRNGQLITPPLSDTILRGVMRDTIIITAADLGIPVYEIPLDIDETLRGIRDGSITEAIASGTAAALTGINSFVLESGEKIPVGDFSPGPITERIYDRIRNIQYGLYEDTHQWLLKFK